MPESLVDNAAMDIKEIRRENLKALLAECYGSQKALADKVGTAPAYISQILAENGKRNVGDELARKAEAAFNRPRGWMDTPLRTQMIQESRAKLYSLQDRIGNPEPILEDVIVPQFSVSASMGPGNEFSEEEVIERWPLNEMILLKMGITPSQAAITSVEGNSMLDTLHDGDLVLVDRTPVTRLSGKVYILWSERMGLQAKRVRVAPDGLQIEVISDNPDKDAYPNRSYDPETFEATFKVRATVAKVFMGSVKEL